MLGIVGERTGNKGEEVMHLGATQAPQALRTDPKCWTGLRNFVNAAAKVNFTPPSSVAGAPLTCRKQSKACVLITLESGLKS